MYKYKATVLKVVDGDTLDLNVDLGFRIFTKIRVRILDIDAYETKGEQKDMGLKIKEATKQLLEGKEILIESFKSNTEMKTDKYGRWLCNVYYDGSKNFKEWIEEHNYNKWSDSKPIFEVNKKIPSGGERKDFNKEH